MLCSKYVADCAKEAYTELVKKPNKKLFVTLAETALVSTIIHNRKRVGNVMYLELDYYNDQRNAVQSKENEFHQVLSENERILTQSYLKINCIGNHTKDMSVLIPSVTVRYFDLIYKIRKTKPDWFLENNDFLFTHPKSAKQIDAVSTLRKYAIKCGAKNPELITCTRLRKHVATVSQLLALRE